MKYLRKITVIATIIVIVMCLVNSSEVMAKDAEDLKDAEELKETWYDTHYYPLYPGTDEWDKKVYDYFEYLDILNPPLDLLLSMPTEELAKLMQDYPSMWQMMTYFDTEGNQDYFQFFCFVEANCDIFYELLRREDGITCLLEEYRTHALDEETLKGDGFYTEIFGCQFIRYYAHHFTDNEYALASQIIEEKKELYLSLSDTQLYYLDLPEIEAPAGEAVSDIRTNYLWPEEIQEREDKIANALLQMQSKENDDNQTQPEENDDNQTQSEENDGNQTQSEKNDSNRNLMIVTGAIIGAVCVVIVFVVVCRIRKKK